MSESGVFQLPSQLTHDQASAVAAQVGNLARTQPSLQIDASRLTHFDSSALAVLLGLRRILIQKGSALRVDGMTPRLRELASLYGVMDLLQPA